MTFRFDPFELNEERRELRLRGREVVVEPLVFDLLLDLVRHRERVVTKDELLDRVWPGAIVTEGSLQRAISLARSALRAGERADAIRTYRVDRIRAVEQTEDEFEPPADLDPVAALEENLGAGWEFPTRVVFDAPAAEVAPWIRPPMGRLEPSPAGGCVLVGSTSNPAMYAQEWLPNVPFPCRVEGGPELRAAVAAVAARLAAAIDD